MAYVTHPGIGSASAFGPLAVPGLDTAATISPALAASTLAASEAFLRAMDAAGYRDAGYSLNERVKTAVSLAQAGQYSDAPQAQADAAKVRAMFSDVPAVQSAIDALNANLAQFPRSTVQRAAEALGVSADGLVMGGAVVLLAAAGTAFYVVRKRRNAA